jgi:uncharacterized RDD family membrane protein YckC
MSSARTNTLIIRTPEGIVFSFLLASPVARFLAYAVDLACISALVSVAGILIQVLEVVSLDFGAAVGTLIFFALQIGCGIVCEWFWRGQTVGKRLLRLRVVDAQGLRVQFSQIAIRNLLRAVDLLPAFYLVGGTAAWLSPKAQRLGDLAANTIVIRTPKIAPPDSEQITAGKFNSLRRHPHLEARLRQLISPVEARLALQALLRREEFEPAARAGLFARLGAHFRGLVEFPPEAVEGITDEQYLRNVVDVLYRPRILKK